MPTFRRSTRAKPNSAPSLPGTATLPNGNGSSSSSGSAPLGQTRLDWIADPMRAFLPFRLKRVEWFVTITSDPETYTSPVLLARAEELGAKIAGLKETLTYPPAGMDGGAWEREAARLARLEGQMQAIRDVLESREAIARATTPRERQRRLNLSRGETGSTAPASPGSGAASSETDPFADE